MGKITSLMNMEFDSEPVYGDNDKHIKTKIKSYGDKVNTNFEGKIIPKENASYKSSPLIMLDSVIRVSKKYYPQTLLEECKNEKRLKWRILLMMIQILAHLMMNLIMKLVLDLIINTLLRIKTVNQ